MLSIGNLEETKGIIRRIADHKTVYWKNNSTLQDLLTEIEALPHYSKKDIRQSIILLEKLDDCIKSIIDGRI